MTLGPPPNPRVRAALAPAARGHVLTLIIDGSRFQDAAVAQKVQAQLARVGAEVRIETLPAAELERRVEAGVEHDLYVGQCALPPVRADLAAAILRACGADALPLYRRSLRAHHVPELRGLRFDAGGRLRLEDAFVWRRAGVALGRP